MAILGGSAPQAQNYSMPSQVSVAGTQNWAGGVPGGSTQYSQGQLGNPFGNTQREQTYGGYPVWGGPSDMMKTLAVRNLAIGGTMDQLNRPAMPAGLQGVLQGAAGYLGGLGGGGARGSQLGSEQQTAMVPALQRGFTTYEDMYKQGLQNVLGAAYQQGGAIRGGEMSAQAQATRLEKLHNLAHTQQIQAILGAISSGLGGGGGGGGGGGIGGGMDTSGGIGTLLGIASGIVGIQGA